MAKYRDPQVSVSSAPTLPAKPAPIPFDPNRPHNDGVRGTMALLIQDGRLYKTDGTPFEE